MDALCLNRLTRAFWLLLPLLVMSAAAGGAFSSTALAQPKGQPMGRVVAYPSTLRIEKGKTANFTAIAYGFTGRLLVNQTLSFKLADGPETTATVRHAPVGSAEGNSRYSKNLAEVAALSEGTVTFSVSLGRLRSAFVTVTVVDPAKPPNAVISGDSDVGPNLFVRPGQPIELGAELSTGVKNIEWSWGDGDRTTELLSTTHAYLYPGNYQIRLRVINTAGASSDATLNAVVTATPRVTRTFVVTSIPELVAIYDQCLGGEDIIIPAGMVLSGQVVLKPRAFSDFVTIRSSFVPSDIGARADPNAGTYATIRGSYPGEIPFVIQNNAGLIRLSGLKFDPFPGSNDTIQNYYMLQIGQPGSQTTIADNPHDIIVDHCVIAPPDNIQVVHAIVNNGYKVSIVSCWIGNIKTYGGQDSQAIYSLEGRGAHIYSNDYLEAASESVIYGGSAGTIDALVPTNIEFRRCVFTKRLSWRSAQPNSVGDTVNEKNLFEMKNGRRVYVEGSLFSNHWDAGRSQYFAITVKSTADLPGGGQGNAWSVSEDIVFENNRLSHANGALNIAPEFDQQGVDYDPLKPRNIRFVNMLVDDVTYGRWGTERGWAILLGGADDLSIAHTTIVDNNDTPDESHELLLYVSTINSYKIAITDSVLPLNYYGIRNSCGEGTRAFTVATSGWFDSQGDSCNAPALSPQNWVFSGNVLPKMRSEHTSANYPTGNAYPNDYSAVGMRGYKRCGPSPAADPCDAPISAYGLSDVSIYKRATGPDPGINVALLTDRLKCTASGETGTCLTTPASRTDKATFTPDF